MLKHNLDEDQTHPRKSKVFQIRLTEQELQLLHQLEAELGISCSDYIRKNIFSTTKTVLINAKALLKELNSIGSDLGETRNHFYRLLNQEKSTDIVRAEDAEFDALFRQYILVQQKLEISMRKIIRLLKN